MIERHITFNVHADRTDAFERFFTDQYGPTMAKAPGFVRVELLREIMLRHGQGDKPIMITESGWNDQPRWMWWIMMPMTKMPTRRSRSTPTSTIID